MRCTLTLLGLSLWLTEFAVSSAFLGQPQESDDNDDDGDEANQIAELVQGDDAVVPTKPPEEQVKASASNPATVSMAASLNSFGAQKDMKHFGAQLHTDAASAAKTAESPAAASPAAAPAAAAPASSTKASESAKVTDAAASQSAHHSFKKAKAAAAEANTIATHSVHLADDAKTSLKKAHDAVHQARVDSAGLSGTQKRSLKAAEAKLKEATKHAEYGQVKNAKYVKAKIDNTKLQNMENKMDKLKNEKQKKHDGELEAMRREIEELRKELKSKEGDKADDDALLKELQDQIEEMEKAEKKSDKKDLKSHDELKAEIEKLRAEIQDMQEDEGKVEYKIPKKEDKGKVEYKMPKKETTAPSMPAPEPEEEEKEEDVEKYNVKMKPLAKSEEEDEEHEGGEATPVEQKGIDIDTAMPYGDLEPFGREDTAQELTENSIQESDGMVDQLERAEVAEEKRSVFRALTRLRGAAITSFDGVARSQTGNIDEYNKIHKWRNTHPLHHLADEESDISKWAFPDNAD